MTGNLGYINKTSFPRCGTGRYNNGEGISPYSVRQWSVLCMTNVKCLVRKRQLDRASDDQKFLFVRSDH